MSEASLTSNEASDFESKMIKSTLALFIRGLLLTKLFVARIEPGIESHELFGILLETGLFAQFPLVFVGARHPLVFATTTHGRIVINGKSMAALLRRLVPSMKNR